MSENETYLGDGLYASHDGFQFKLRAPRENGDHEVYLEPLVLSDFLAFITQNGGRPMMLKVLGLPPDPQPDLTPDDKEPF